MKSFKSFIAERCWPGHKAVPGKKPYSPGSCVKEEIIFENFMHVHMNDVAGKKVEKRVFVAGKKVETAHHNARKYYEKKGFTVKKTQYVAGPLRHDVNKSNQTMKHISEDWSKVNKADKTDGLSQKAVDAYRRENPGSKLKTAVTEKNPSGKRASRRKSFCSRMGGMKKRLTNPENARDPDSPINKALRRWNC